MKNIILGLVLFCLSLSVYAEPKLQVKQTQVPILTNREDNVLFYIRIDSEGDETLDNLTITLDGDIDLSKIKNLKLYYGGTDTAERNKKTFYAPNEYLSRENPKYTRKANTSYSILKDQSQKIKKNVTLKADQKLFPGVNYFWVSLETKPDISILSTIEATVTDAKINGKSVNIDDKEANKTQRLGVGVRYAGDDNAASYRIPGLVTSNDGTLLAVYDVRYNNSADLQEYVEIGLSRSTDKGQTWEKMTIPMSFGEYGGLPKSQNGVGDPAILVDKETGTIWIIAAWTHAMGNGRAWTNSGQGMDKNQTAQLMLVKSDDDGKTWSEPINITSQVKDPSWYFLLQGPGNGITMDDGTLVFASQYIGADRIPNAGIIYSKDHGKTWNIKNHARTNTTEAQVVEIAPGELMLNMRDNRGGSRAVYTTKDMGQTWKEHESSRTALVEPVCMASLINSKADDNVLNQDVLLFSNPNTTNHRKDITIKASLDGGYTWDKDNQLLLDEGYGWGYSCLTMIDDETVGIIYEGSTAHMVFQAVKLKDLLNSINK